jgi:hypothetical protein
MHWHNENSTLIFWAAIAIIVVARSYFRNQSRMARYRMMEAMARQGQSIPPEMMADGRRSDWDHGWDRGWDRHFTIGHGIMLMCIGVAVSAFLWAMSGGGGFFHGEDVPNWLPLVGAFPFMIGLGRVIIGLTAPRWEKPK